MSPSKRFAVITKKWVALYLSQEDYAKIVADDSTAECDEKAKTIYADLEELDEEAFIHELTHAYLHEASFTELQLNEKQKEEFLCELNAKYGKAITRQARMLFKYGLKVKAAREKRIAEINL